MKKLRTLLPVLCLLVFAGCSPTIPVITPVEAPRVKPGEKYEAIVLLPNNTIATVHLHYASRADRIAITGVAIVNNAPEKVNILYTRTKFFIGGDEPLGAATYRPLDRKNRVDFDIMKDAPAEAEGMWVIPPQQIVRKKDFKGPVVVLFYSVDGTDGFVKIYYNTIWGDSGSY